jgi:vacuolar-type H+-ATPase subunit I/STV1
VLWYGLLSVVLLVVWAMSGRDSFWPIWPILGFALFLGWHAFNLLGPQAPDQSRRRDRDR